MYELFSETIRNMFGCGCYFMLWSCLVWLEEVCWIDHVLSFKECVCYACYPSVCLEAPSICLFVFYMSEVISSFKGLRAGSQVFTPFLFIFVILHTMLSGKSLQLLCILPFGMLCLAVKLCWQCVSWWIWWSERKRTLCLPLILSGRISCSWLKSVGFVAVCSYVVC